MDFNGSSNDEYSVHMAGLDSIQSEFCGVESEVGDIQRSRLRESG